jgi:hypothetical protein
MKFILLEVYSAQHPNVLCVFNFFGIAQFVMFLVSTFYMTACFKSMYILHIVVTFSVYRADENLGYVANYGLSAFLCQKAK